jgi:Mg/Co/Ni transporter MgtE
VEFLRGDPHAVGEGRDYHRRVASLQPAEIATLLSSVPYLHAAELLTLLPDAQAADTLEVMQPERQVQVFDEFDDTRRIRLLQLMAPDNAADLIARLGPDGAKPMLDGLPAANREAVIDLLRYPEHTAGGIMTNDVVMAPAGLSVAEARLAIREAIARPDFVYYVYMVDAIESRKLQGVITLRDLLVSDDDRPIAEVMQSTVAALNPLMLASEAARRVADQHLAALPVVSSDGRLLGAVTADAAIRHLAPASILDNVPRIFS